MNDQIRNEASSLDTAPAEDEQALFDSALNDSDRLLLDSLQRDERRRRRRRLVFASLLLGGIVMGTTCVAVLAGWLTLAATSASGQVVADQELQQLVPGQIVDTRRSASRTYAFD